MSRTLLTVLCLFFLWLGGCAKASSGAAMRDTAYPGAPPPPAEPMAEAAADDASYSGGAPAMAPSPMGGLEREEAPARSRDYASVTVASPASGTSKAEPEPAIADPKNATPGHGRQIIYTASMQVAVYNVQEAMKVAEALPEQLGGWVHTRSEGLLTMKLPARRLREAMEALGRLGNVEVRELHAQDVTDEYVDLETRIRVLRETQSQLLELLKRAKTVEEALNVRQALDDVTMQLETSLGRMRQLENQIAFSTLTVTLVERGPHQQVPSSNDPFPWVDSLGVEATEWR